jgi:hypothetical protein
MRGWIMWGNIFCRIGSLGVHCGSWAEFRIREFWGAWFGLGDEFVARMGAEGR